MTKSFAARYACAARTYEYYLPTSALGLPTGDPAEDAARIALFRRALQLYVGSRPFHNFTNRKQYAPPPRPDRVAAAAAATAAGQTAAGADGSAGDSADDGAPPSQVRRPLDHPRVRNQKVEEDTFTRFYNQTLLRFDR